MTDIVETLEVEGEGTSEQEPGWLGRQIVHYLFASPLVGMVVVFILAIGLSLSAKRGWVILSLILVGVSLTRIGLLAADNGLASLFWGVLFLIIAALGAFVLKLIKSAEEADVTVEVWDF